MHRNVVLPSRRRGRVRRRRRRHSLRHHHRNRFIVVECLFTYQKHEKSSEKKSLFLFAVCDEQFEVVTEL